jgi:PAS domain S-box-containing protein
MNQSPADPLNNPARLDALRRAALLDTPAEEAFDRLTRLASKILHAPISLVSLVDDKRQFFKSEIGLSEPWASRRQTPLSHSFCQHAVASGQPLIIEDARQHPLVRDNLAIVDLSIIAYAGIPLITRDGHPLGSFCVIDRQPRVWTSEDIDILKDLAASVMTEIELRAAIRDAEQAVDKLHESRAQLQDLFDNATDLIQSVSPEERFLYVNRAWQETLGYLDEEAAGLSLSDIIHPDQRQHFLALVQRVMARPTVEWVEVTFIAKDGRPVAVEGNISCRFQNGHPVATRGIFRDITGRKRAEAEVRRAIEKEKELGELKLRFVSMASHEFRTPLSVILSSAELLENYGEGWPPEKKTQHYRRIEAAVENMTYMLDNVLVIGRAEAGRLQFNPAPLDLEKFCHDLVEEIRLSLGREHEIVFDCIAGCSEAHVDEKLLRQILSNLLSNAVKYSPQGSQVCFTLNCSVDRAVFVVQDHGLGIPAGDQPRLFESFHRAKNVGSIPGTGLGLTIVKKSVDLHGGDITFTSEPGVGSMFSVSVPLEREGS